MKRVVQIELPEEVLIALKETPEELAKEIKILAAVKFYQMGKLSSGRAAELAGIPRVSFLQSLSRYKVPIFELTPAELKEDLKNA